MEARRSLAWPIAAAASLSSCCGGRAPAEVSSEPRAASPTKTPAKTERTCPETPWTTYAHDAQRTSASEGCVSPSLRLAWRYLPDTPGARESQIAHAIATATAIYASGTKGDSPTITKLDRDGNVLWTFDSRADIARYAWPTLAHDMILLNDDGLYFANDADGKAAFYRRMDTWGQSLADDARWYVTNTWHVEGPGAFVGAIGTNGEFGWKANTFGGQTKEDVQDDAGAIALAKDVLVETLDIKFTRDGGVFAFDATTGRAKWSAHSFPASDVSSDGERVFDVERDARGKDMALVARDVTTGNVAWRAPVKACSPNAPVVAAGLVVIESDGALLAFDAKTGKARYERALARKKSSKTPLHATTFAAALGSKTLVATIDGSLHVYAIDDGRDLGETLVEAGADVHSPVVVGERVYVVANGALFAFEPPRSATSRAAAPTPTPTPTRPPAPIPVPSH